MASDALYAARCVLALRGHDPDNASEMALTGALLEVESYQNLRDLGMLARALTRMGS